MSAEIDTKEFFRHYSDTWVRVKYKEFPDWVMAYFHVGEWGRSRKQSLVVFTAQGKKITTHLGDVEFDLRPPSYGVVPHSHYGKMAFLVSRNAQRQWKWGLCPNNVHIQNILSKDGLATEAINHLHRHYGVKLPSSAIRTDNGLRLDDKIAQDILFPKYDEYHASVRKLSECRTALAVIDSQHYLTLSPIHRGGVLWKWDCPLARLWFKEGKVSRAEVINPILKQEVIDFFNRRKAFNVEFTDKQG